MRHSILAETPADQVQLRLLATTDLHVHLHPYDYFADRAVQSLGLARTAILIGRLRASAPNTLLLDNGDMLQGSPMGDYVAEARGMRAGDIHPSIAAMNALGYDAATLGNHEFNYGLPFLRACISGANFPFVCANVEAEGGEDTLLPPYVLLDRTVSDGAGRCHPLRIGVIGALPPQIVVWDRAHLARRITSRDIVPAVAACLPRMKAEGADIIIALCHSGIGGASAQPGMENAATALAGLAGIDAVIAGHSHMVFPGPGFAGLPGVDAGRGRLAGKPAVMPGCFGSHLGVIDLSLGRKGQTWQVAGARSKAVPVATLAAKATGTGSEALREATRADHEATLVHIRRPVGRTSIPLNSFFAALPGNAALALVARAQASHIARVLQGTPEARLPLLSAASPFKMGGRGGAGFFTDVPAGELALRHVADLYAYPNTISAVLVTGAELQDWLERAAGVFNRIEPGNPSQHLINPAIPASQFDVIDGVTWAIDLSQPARFDRQGDLADPQARRIRDLRHKGRPVSPEGRFVIATNSYRAGGGDGFPGTPGDTILHSGPETNRDILMRHIAAAGTIGPMGPPVWQFHPLPGTSAIFDTAPAAAAHLGTLAPLRVEPEGSTTGGFARFRIHF